MELQISTPALLFPAVSLLFLSYTNRFLHLAALIRQLHGAWMSNGEPLLRAQIENLRKRMVLIRWMQLFGSLSLLLCVVSMVSVMLGGQIVGWIGFGGALVLMGISLAALTHEVVISGGALAILLKEMEQQRKS